MPNPVEVWKAERHGFDVWPDVLRYAGEKTPMARIETPDHERMKWHGADYRKRDGDGTYMLRIRLTGCELTSEQAKAIAYLAYETGYDIVDVTTRANLQVQGLAIEDVPRAIERLGATGLTARQTGHDNVRNVFGHPLSGVDPDELIDVRGLCREVTGVFSGKPRARRPAVQIKHRPERSQRARRSFLVAGPELPRISDTGEGGAVPGADRRNAGTEPASRLASAGPRSSRAGC